MITLYGIKNCDSVKKARKWLESNSLDYQFHDFRTDGISKALVQPWLDAVGADTLLNKRSTSWKQLSDKQKTTVDVNDLSAKNKAAIALFLEAPTLIKRPVLVTADEVHVGFKADNYAAFL